MHYARPAPLAMCATRVDDLFARTASLADFTLQRQGVTLVCTVAPDVPPLSTDPDKMDQVLLNLVLNGADAMPGGGVLTLDARLDPGAGSTVRITVRDTGPGVPEEHRERIFDPFFTTKHSGQGTGLGLAVSAAIVARHGGTLALEPPVPGDPPGAVFVISLPFQEPPHDIEMHSARRGRTDHAPGHAATPWPARAMTWPPPGRPKQLWASCANGPSIWSSPTCACRA